jgi:hypothetical protein
MRAAKFRQWAMIHAMQGLLANRDSTFGMGQSDMRSLAKIAVNLADALVEANTIDEPAPSPSKDKEPQ